jgi:CheY-like chemotaxis protein
MKNPMGRGAGEQRRARSVRDKCGTEFRLATTMTRKRHVILVVDDDHDLRESLREILEEEGFETIGASDGREAIELLRAGGQPRPRVILLDIMMPVMTGLDVIDRIRHDRTLAKTPVVLMTAFRTLVNANERARVLFKPFSIDGVLAAIRNAC